jgi:hypothetical protein
MINVSGLTEAKATLLGLLGEMPKIDERIQNALVYEVWNAEKAEMQDSFDGGPAPNTVKQIVYQKYGKRNLTSHDGAGVYIKDIFRTDSLAMESGPDRHYLSVMELGGKPADKRSVIRFRAMGIIEEGWTWVPAIQAAKTAQGNLKSGDVSNMFTNLGIGFVETTNKTFKYIYGDELRPIGVQRKRGQKWYPYLWFIREPTYDGGNFLWTFTGEITVNRHFERIANYYMDRALREHM